MKILFCRSNVSKLVSAAAMWCLAQGAALAVTFSLSPSEVSNTYSGLITLKIDGLTNGEQVAIQKYIDLNANGTVDQGEPMADSFRISDGGALVIGGVTNINVPFDSNPTNGAITTTLGIAPPRSLGNLVGQFIFSVSSPVQHFAPQTATLRITNAALAQSVSGVVYSNGVAPQPYAVVAVLQMSPGNNGNGRWVGGDIADNTGHYHINLPPGSYGVFPTLPGYFTDQSLAASVTLTNGMSVTNNLFLTNGAVTISGEVLNAANSNGVAGLLMPLEGGNLFAIAATDTNGHYTVGVGPGSWKVKVESDAVAERAFVVPQNKILVDTTTGSVANVTVMLPKADAMFYGTFTNAAGQAMANIQLSAQDNFNQYEASGTTDANGHYCVAVLGGTNTWYCNPDNSDPALASYIVSSSNGTNLNSGQALLLNVTAVPATAHISGHVQDNLGHAVVGIGISASATIGGVPFNTYIDTDTNGNYALSAASGVWNIFANCCGSDGLDNFGLADLLAHSARIPPTNATVNLTLYPYGTPALSQPNRFGPSSFGFNLSGAAGTNYTIQASTNLASTNWFTILVTNLPYNFVFLQDNQATNRQRFYRALHAP